MRAAFYPPYNPIVNHLFRSADQLRTVLSELKTLLRLILPMHGAQVST
jgi:hypothetical protein